MQLDTLQRELEARFEQISGERAENWRIFALEHGLSIDMEELAASLSEQLRCGNPNQFHWLVWVVFATEIGYSFAGAEYWQTFNERLPAWRRNADSNRNRNLIRAWFRRFAKKYNGVRPSGTWAKQFSIIAWPITHAILPKDLQHHFAKSLHNHRYRLAADNNPISIGQLIHGQALTTSSRFREFSEQEELAGRIALALLGVESEESPLSPDATKRIVGDLEATQAAKDWLHAAREVRRIQGARKQKQRHTERTPQARQQAPAERLSLSPRLLLSKANNRWRVGVLIPSFAPLAFDVAGVGQFLRTTKVQLQGGTGTWQPAQILTGTVKLHMLQQWPNDGVVVKFKDSHPILEHLMRHEGTLSNGPLWVCKVGADGLARHVRQNLLRPGHEYIALAKAGFAFPHSPAFESVDVQCTGIVGVRLKLPKHVPDDIRRVLKLLGLSLASTVTIWPAGIPAISWDGEGLSEWLTTDSPCFGIDVDREVAAVDVVLNGTTRLTISRCGITGPSWLQLRPLPPGRYSLNIEVKVESGEHAPKVITGGEVHLDVRDPLGLEATVSQRGGLMAIPVPVDATLEDLEEGKLTLDLFGPQGREVSVLLKIDGPEPTRFPLGKADLPVSLTGLWEKLSTDDQEILGVSASCQLVVSAEEMGSFALPLERVSRPVRWLLKRSRQAISLRLIDEAGLGAQSNCHMAPLETPNTAQLLDHDECVDGFDVQEPGGLYVVAGKGRLDAVIVSLPNQQGRGDLASQIGFTPRLEGFAASDDTVKDDIQLLTLWTKARVVGSLGPARQKKVVRTMRDALTKLVCGSFWVQAEAVFEDSIKDQSATADLGELISTSQARRNFAAKLRMSHREAIEKSPAEVVLWLLPISKAFGICNDKGVIEKALRFLTDLIGFVTTSSDVPADVRELATQGDLVRGVRYLLILLEGKSWDWS
ncbi:hypothetical protein [Sulfuricella sp.]|uniref:hypothetical protein n=1 Tax=Sulfuricella sp. TaxID=2099377 RepID=UPI002C753A3B|nr:hypothetical protein [Sulfuricella sp.]HUX62784.1 hypothetical protein [Sulfuricella sp.]